MDFLSDDFLLDSPLAKSLYRACEKMPIIDYHSHVSPRQIADDTRFSDITELWLGGDHYKWRLMRNCGVPERLITGDGDSYEKFEAFASIMPRLVGNPMYVWSHLELRRYFGEEGFLCRESARRIYDLCNKKLAQADYSVRNIIKRSNVELVCTTDDPVDTLVYHTAIKASGFDVPVLPSFRPDKAIHAENADYPEYIASLSAASGIAITDAASLVHALKTRLDYFVERGCSITDHAFSDYIYQDCTEAEANSVLKKRLGGGSLTAIEAEKFQTYILLSLAREYSRRNMVMQLHFSAIRNPNSRMMSAIGPDTGFDAINASTQPAKLARLLDALDRHNELPKTIVYSLYPADNRVIESIINSFQGEGICGKIQHGSAWWFNDSKFGITEHLESLAEDSVLGNFIGMLTDSRSFVSYTRHEYFRRILCRFVARQVESGEYPSSPSYLETLVKDISYYNAKRYFGL